MSPTLGTVPTETAPTEAAPTGTAPIPRRLLGPRWSERTQVERVHLYVVQSLYVLLVGFCAVPVVPLLARMPADRGAVSVVVTLVAAVLTVLGLRALRASVVLYPARGPLPLPEILALAAGAVLALGVAATLADDPRSALALVVFASLAAGLGGLCDPRVLVTLVVALPLVVGVTSQWWGGYLYGLAAGLFVIFTVRTSLWLYDVVRQLEQGRGAQAALAVAEERLRFSRDVHDVLGRRLSEIAVHAELAGRLAEVGDPGAARRMEEVRATAHQALGETRTLARGYRTTDLDHELAGARSLLAAAGISTSVDLERLPARWREPAGWVVREAVTNVLRHSRASTVVIDATENRLVVRNDGVPTPVEPRHGQGLRGLRERLEPAGATLSTTVDDGWFVLEVVVVAP